MNHRDIINVQDNNERVTSTYAEIYYENEYCKIPKPEDAEEILKTKKSVRRLSVLHQDEWISPSDLLIGIINLKPPFTSKITRGKAHEGLLAIGNNVLENERHQFYKSLTKLINENVASWECILRNKRKSINKKVKNIYENIFQHKRNIMVKEIYYFYEKSLAEIEEHLKSEIQTVLESTNANIITDLNIKIKEKLENEKKLLELKLNKKCISEIKKIKEYYSLLMNNELKRYNHLKNCTLKERNEALKAYYKQMEAEKITSVMYILSLERKKCRIKKMLLEKHQNAEISEKLQKIKEKNILLDIFKEREVDIPTLNMQWENKIKKIIQLFLRFISFSLKLLPEQTAFLLDLEKMVIFQLNEIHKYPNVRVPILLNEDEQENIFQFAETEKAPDICTKEPFILIGDLSDPEPPRYGSRETLPSDVDLPFFRVQRHHVYAKCHGYEEIKKMLDTQVCKCSRKLSIVQIPLQEKVLEEITETVIPPPDNESSDERILIDDLQAFRECPVRKCADWTKKSYFPYLPDYLDFTEENYKRVKTILTHIPTKYESPKLINPKDIAYSELPFSVTKELQRTVETQYSSQEDLTIGDLACPCIEGIYQPKRDPSQNLQKMHSGLTLNEILTKRKISLDRLFCEHPKLLQLFTDEKYNYKM